MDSPGSLKQTGQQTTHMFVRSTHDYSISGCFSRELKSWGGGGRTELVNCQVRGRGARPGSAATSVCAVRSRLGLTNVARDDEREDPPVDLAPDGFLHSQTRSQHPAQAEPEAQRMHVWTRNAHLLCGGEGDIIRVAVDSVCEGAVGRGEKVPPDRCGLARHLGLVERAFGEGGRPCVGALELLRVLVDAHRRRGRGRVRTRVNGGAGHAAQSTRTGSGTLGRGD